MIKQTASALFKLALLGGVLIPLTLWVEHNRPVDLPVPSGPFAVGRSTAAWIDEDQKHQLAAWIWYPAEAGQAFADYLPTPLRTQVERSRGLLIGKFLTRDLSRVHGHSFQDAGMSPRERSYPVVIMRAGASAEVFNYSTLAEDLASHGYFVVGFDAAYRTNVVVFPDGRVTARTRENNVENCEGQPPAQLADCVNRLLYTWTGDVAFALDRLAMLNANGGSFSGRLDMTRVGIFGHSFGGAAALQFCHDDPRCKAGIDLDGEPFGSVVQDGLHVPFMFVLTDQIHGSDPETRRVLGDIQSIYDRLPPQGRSRILIRGSNHFLFSDDGALLKSHLVTRTLRALGILGIDGRRQLAVTTYCVQRFFDAYLKGQHFEIATPLYPEIQPIP